MITINEVTLEEKKYLIGKIGKENYSIVRTPENLEVLRKGQRNLARETNKEGYDMILEDVLTDINGLDKNFQEAYISGIVDDEVIFDHKKKAYFLKDADGNVAKAPIHKFFVNKMLEAIDKDLDHKPWLKFWVRLMRNPLYTNNAAKVNNMITYLKASYIDKENVEKLVKDGYVESVAIDLSTFDQISINEEGCFVPFKYVALLDKKYVVEVNKETGEQEIKHVDMYNRLLEVDPITGEITKDELDLPVHAEDLTFYPPIMGLKGRDAFTCRDIDEETEEVGHIIKVGKVHELLEGFKAVNCDDNSAGVKGLKLGSAA